MFMFLMGGGVAVATAIWNASEMAEARGSHRQAHAAVIGFLIVVLLSFGFGWPSPLTQLAGAGLSFAAVTIAFDAARRHRAICAAQVAFGALAAMGLPLASV